ncbi:DUF922 domain-containing protein [Photobacterium sp. 1_MG-2023]|uniref:DUF922 domain-containing protein n=1 Tax=Photobacterium sp. 1_MG-2023 TaxID=3062646 RepID=UPI0026E255B6|nr:DUF922 domain-containing protein [Photobacterium sp. 1_MG-2023]MDO6706359.1 DUF922 domain-containing protein [Photobacterium sp. 1_MG-2023]
MTHRHISYLLFLCSVHLAHADEQLPFPFHKAYEIYSVSGHSDAEIDASYEKRPAHLKEKGFDAYLAWNYDFYYDDLTCEIDFFTLDVKYTLPQLSISPENEALLKGDFVYAKQLYAHEERHCAIALSQLHAIYQLIKKGQRDGCETVQDLIDVHESNITEMNRNFDVYTNHGEIELAVSPFGEDDFLPHCKIETPVSVHVDAS